MEFNSDDIGRMIVQGGVSGGHRDAENEEDRRFVHFEITSTQKHNNGPGHNDRGRCYVSTYV